MAVLYPSNEWAEAFCKAINNDETCAEKGKKWGVDFKGDFLFELQPGSGLEKTTYVYIPLKAGKCEGARLIDDPSEVDQGILCIGPYEEFKAIVKGELDFIDELIKGKLKLKGDMTKVVRNAMFLRAVSGLLKSIETTFLGE